MLLTSPPQELRSPHSHSTRFTHRAIFQPHSAGILKSTICFTASRSTNCIQKSLINFLNFTNRPTTDSQLSITAASAQDTQSIKRQGVCGAHRFRGLSPWLVGLIALGPILRCTLRQEYAMLIKLLALWSGTENGEGKETKVARFLLRGGRGDLNSSH